MPTILGPRYDPAFSGYPPRMSQEDFPIWQKLWPKIRPQTIALYFDVGLGLADHLPASEDAAQLLGWIRNTQKRADVIAEQPTAALVIELRFNAQLNAVGRLLGYKKLLEQDNPFRKPVLAMLATNRPDSEVKAVCEDQQIIYEVV